MLLLSPWVTEAASIRQTSPVDSLLTEEMIHTLRDPFQPPVAVAILDHPKAELETFQLKDLRLNGVITGPKKTRAMITAPNGKAYFVANGEAIGLRDGHVASINPDAVRVIEYDRDAKGRKVPETFEMRLSGDVVSLTKKKEED